MNTKIQQKYILYLIVDKERSLLKIGKTRTSHSNNRYKQIANDFKIKSFKESLYIESIEEKDIDNLERILHKAFYKDRKETKYKNGIGKTEWFSLKILDEVLDQIEFFRKRNNTYSKLSPIKKGLGVEGYSGFTFFYFIKIMFFLGIIFSGTVLYLEPNYMEKLLLKIL